ncbi:MAG: hypothetical protein OZSIB_0474 [Candidatus Ozemobacter sibiricus]|uniref:Uncharacterized protein n=1 Tax=Candidatus Ozemobacter sibiricus TaxID=2268124 RepID=A0A367ZLF8_9BACT|nr:MAG: hypothetical protein OZSIB_0474 [Candidatus Ozemobacter sibiricus]
MAWPARHPGPARHTASRSGFPGSRGVGEGNGWAGMRTTMAGFDHTTREDWRRAGRARSGRRQTRQFRGRRAPGGVRRRRSGPPPTGHPRWPPGPSTRPVRSDLRRSGRPVGRPFGVGLVDPWGPGAVPLGPCGQRREEPCPLGCRSMGAGCTWLSETLESRI